MIRQSSYKIAIWGNHLDLYQHVNHARYIEFLEEARWAHFGGTQVLAKMKKLGLGFVIVNLNIDYLHPSTMGDVLIIKTNLRSIGHKSAQLFQDISLNSTDKKVAEAKITFVLLDMKTQKAVPVDEKLKSLLLK
ncbi:MAG: thioesterase family protein [Bacteroidia bacterium]